MNKHIITLIFGLFIAFSTLTAQTNQWFHFAPNDRMNDMARDGDDLWIHTEDGIVKFDVKTNKFVFFDVTDSVLKSNQVHGLTRISGGDGIVVVTYDFGLLSVDNGQWTYHDTLSSNLPSYAYDLIDVTTGNDGAAWMITRANPTLVRFDGDTFETFSIPDTTFPDLGATIAADDEGNIWAGTDFRLLKFKDSVWTDYTPGLAADGGTIAGTDFIYRDRSDRVWLNSAGNLYRYDGSNWTLMEDDFGKVDICEDDMNGIWVTRNAGTTHELYKLVNDSLELRNSSNSNLPSDYYSTVYRDWDDGVWMGGNPGLLTWFKDGIWEAHNLANSAITDRVNLDIETDILGQVWVLNRDSLQRFNGKKWETFTNDENYLGEKIIPIDSQFLFTLSTEENLNRISNFRGNHWVVYDTSTTFINYPDLALVDIVNEENYKLWVLGKQRLFHFDMQFWIDFTSSLPTITEPLSAITSAHGSGVWFCSENATKLYRFYSSEDGLEDSIYINPNPWNSPGASIQMFRDAEEIIYMYSDERITKFEDGLFTDIHTGISPINHLMVKDSQLVISSNMGLYFYEEGIGIVDSITTRNSLLRLWKAFRLHH